jgi:hypothetical protein
LVAALGEPILLHRYRTAQMISIPERGCENRAYRNQPRRKETGNLRKMAVKAMNGHPRSAKKYVRRTSTTLSMSVSLFAWLFKSFCHTSLAKGCFGPADVVQDSDPWSTASGQQQTLNLRDPTGVYFFMRKASD